MTIDAPPADVLVAGGGPAGSATALRLARLGHRVTLLDRAHFPRRKPCSEYMSPETVRHLAALGVLEALTTPGGAALIGTRVSGPLGSVMQGEFARAGGTPFRSTGLGLPREVLDAALFRAAQDAGVRTHEHMTVREAQRGADGLMRVTVTDREGKVQQLAARAVVAADGVGSVLARRSGLHRQGRLARVAFVAHVRNVQALSSTTELHVGPAGYIGINNVGGGVANVALVVPRDHARAARGDAAAFMHATLQTFPALADRIDLSQRAHDVMVTGPFHAMCRRSTADGLLLVGDAADFFDPFTGEGIGTALRGAELAADVLHTALASGNPVTARALRSYRSARRQAFAGKWLVERLIGYAMLSPRLFDRAISRLHARGMGDTLVGVTGHFVSPWRVINPLFLTRMVW